VPETALDHRPETQPVTVTRGAAAGLRRQRRVWDRRASRWAANVVDNPGLSRVVEAVVAAALAHAGPDLGTVVDLGSGSGQLILRLAGHADRAVAVDVSPAMLEALAERAADAGVGGIEPRCEAIEHLDVPPGSVDLVVSNYALHHLTDRDKAALLARVYRWLRPGGWLIVGDMMLGRGRDRADRAVLAGKLRSLARLGPGGWWRIAKNAYRFLLRVEERPLPPAAWTALASRAGFPTVSVVPIVHEAHLLVAQRPA
jgi:SAM-dependent methyltransferase